jgi:hypothetical protein
VQHAHDNRPSLHDTKIDVVATVNREADAGADLVARYAGMAKSCYLLQVGVEAKNEAIRDREVL